MTEHLKRHYAREEEFLDEFSGMGPAVSKALAGDYQPDYGCDDTTRASLEYLLHSGELHSLTFDGASVYHENGRFSSAQVVLRSSNRVVTVRVRLPRGSNLSYETEIVVDREL